MVGARVLIVEDHDLLAQSLSLALRADDLDVQHCRPATEDAVLDLATTWRPAVVLLDLDLGHGLPSSVPLIQPLTDLGAEVVMVTGIAEAHRLGECVEAGAAGIVQKSQGFDDLVASVHRLLAGDRLLAAAERERLLGALRREREREEANVRLFTRLTPRERQVLGALMEGRSAEAIAREWVVSLSTVRTQIRSVLGKLEVNSQLSAVALARRAGWEPDADGAAR